MDDQQLLRYNRQILLPQIDIEGQQTLANSCVMIVGLGGLGCPAALYLAASGIGKLILIDDDDVELSNLQRQIAYSQDDITKAKSNVLKNRIKNTNAEVCVISLNEKFKLEKHHDYLDKTDVIIDATDNFQARDQINKASIKYNKPLVFAAAIRMEGQISVFDPRCNDSPCYRCIYDDVNFNESCSESGILGSVVATLATMQATETIKLLLNIGEPLVGRLQLYDALTSQWSEIKISKRLQCQACR